MPVHENSTTAIIDVNNKRIETKFTNDATVFEAMKRTDRKLSISEIHSLCPHITEKTVRRAIKDLCDQGYVIPHGASGNRRIYSVVDQAINLSTDTDKIIPLNGTRVALAQFVKAMVDPESNPLKNNTEMNPLATKSTHEIRRRMLAVIATSGNPGFSDLVNRTKAELLLIQIELEYAAKLIKDFNESPVWFDHYRDRIAPEVRKLQRDNPEMYQLMQDYIKGGS